MSPQASRTLSCLRVGPVAGAMFDILADGHWAPTETVLAAGSETVDADTAVRWGARDRKDDADDRLKHLSGARSKARNDLLTARRGQRVQEKNGMHRLAPGYVEHWRAHRGMAPLDRRHVDPAKDRVVGGWLESDAWAQAPLQTRDQIHFRPTFKIDDLARFARALPGHAVPRVAPDGQHLVDCAAGTGDATAQAVIAWLTAADHHHDGVRIERALRRRDLNDLPGDFLTDLYRTSFGPAKSRLSASMSSLKVLVPEQSDIDQLIRLWILEAAAKFDADKGVPFVGYLANVLPKWVQNLNRASYGRTAADHELKHQRATSAFQQDHHRLPTEAELAHALDVDLSTVRRNRVNLSVLSGLRHQTPLMMADEGGYEPVGDEDTEGDVLGDESDTLLSHALIQSTLVGKDPNPVGLLAIYFSTWGEWTKSDLARIGGTSVRSLNARITEAEDAVRNAMSGVR